MKRQRHFQTEQELIDMIDKKKAELEKLRAMCASGGISQDEEDKISKKARRIEDATLPHLKNALAAFRAEVFEFSKEDKSVVL